MKLTNRYRERFGKIIHSYQGKAIGFRVDEIRVPDNKKSRREYLTHPGAVGVLAIDSKSRIILVKQHRYPVDEFTYEIPAGKLTPGEKPLACVKRELEEEAGVRAKTILPLLSFWPTAAFSNEVIHLFIAGGLIETAVNPDEDEFIELARKTPDQMMAMIRRGQIRDSKTIIAFLAWKSGLAER
jgi:ADP-ribose pyrophosphatase